MDTYRLLPGRPFGGCAILFRKSLLPCVTTLQSNSNRFCAISLIDSNGASILLINVYLPTDYGTSLSEFEFVSLLSELEAYADTHPHDFIIIGGDFNVDFRRTCKNTIALSNFMSQLHLCSADSLFHSTIPYTYMRDDHSTSSWIDHFICSESIVTQFSSIALCGSGTNLSDHEPLFAVLLMSPHLSLPLPAPVGIIMSILLGGKPLLISFLNIANLLLIHSLPHQLKPCFVPSLIVQLTSMSLNTIVTLSVMHYKLLLS